MESWHNMRRRHVDELADAVDQLNKQGMTQVEAAQALGMAPRALNNYLRRMGIQWLVKKPGRRPDIPEPKRDPEFTDPYGAQNHPVGK